MSVLFSAQTGLLASLWALRAKLTQVMRAGPRVAHRLCGPSLSPPAYLPFPVGRAHVSSGWVQRGMEVRPSPRLTLAIQCHWPWKWGAWSETPLPCNVPWGFLHSPWDPRCPLACLLQPLSLCKADRCHSSSGQQGLALSTS